MARKCGRPASPICAVARRGWRNPRAKISTRKSTTRTGRRFVSRPTAAGSWGTAGRGASQADAVIAAALADGWLVGASLGVFEDEPLAPESPLWGMTNLVITPHIAAVSSPRALARNILDQITAFESGLPLQNLIDPARGY